MQSSAVETTAPRAGITSCPRPAFISPHQQKSRAAVTALQHAAREVAEVAENVQAVCARATAQVTSMPGGRPYQNLLRTQRLLSTLTDKRGLGLGITGGLIGTLVHHLGGMLGRDCLFNRVAISSLRLRIEASKLAHPELVGDRRLVSIIDAVCQDRDLAAVAAIYALFRDMGAVGALSRLAPAMTEVFALKALRDENPFNDKAAWQIAVGKAPPRTDLLAGLPLKWLTAWDRGSGVAQPVTVSDYESAAIQRPGGLLNFLRNIELLGNDGRILIQTVKDDHSRERFVVHTPGARPGKAWNTSPQDLAGAVRAVLDGRCCYLGAVKSAITQYGIPDGAEILVVGHSMGGIVGMLLAENHDFCQQHRLTHVISLGSPITHRRPADPSTQIISITNQHDIFTALDGSGSGSCFPPPPDWYIVDYTLPTHQFPECHSPSHYLHDLEYLLGDCRTAIEKSIDAYRGEVVRSQVYQVYDTAPKTQRDEKPAGKATIAQRATG